MLLLDSAELVRRGTSGGTRLLPWLSLRRNSPREVAVHDKTDEEEVDEDDEEEQQEPLAKWWLWLPYGV